MVLWLGVALFFFYCFGGAARGEVGEGVSFYVVMFDLMVAIWMLVMWIVEIVI